MSQVLRLQYAGLQEQQVLVSPSSKFSSCITVQVAATIASVPGDEMSRSAMPLRLCAAGEPISTRWTQAVKQEIKQSRIAVTRQVVVCVPSLETHARLAQSQTTSVFAMLPAFLASYNKQWQELACCY